MKKFGFYVSYVQDGVRVQKSTNAQSKKEALLFLLTLNQKDTPPVQKLLSEFVDEFKFYSRTNKSAKSTENDLRALTWLLNIVGNKLLTSITVSDIEKFKSHRLESVSPTTVNIDLRACKAVFNVALRWNYLSKNPFIKVKLLVIPPMGRKYLSPGEIETLLECINERWLKEVNIFALNTGMRRGEITNLKWTDVSLESREIHIRNSEDFVVKGLIGRTIPMNDTVYQLLSTKLPTGEYVLVNANGKKLYPNYVRERFKHYVLKAGLDQSLYFHHLRHTFATLLVQDGAPIYELKELLGHKDVKTTQIYLHMEVETLRGSVARLDKMNFVVNQ